VPLEKNQAAAVLSNPHSTGTSMLMILVDELGTDFFSWEPNTLTAEVKDTWKIEMPQICRDKVWSLVNYLTTNLFFTSIEVFTHTCNALASSSSIDMLQYDPPTVAEICWAMMETTLLEPAGEDGELSDEVLTLIAQTLEAEGYHKVPRALRKYVKLPAVEERINEALALDGVDYNGYWDAQQRKLIALDQSLVSRLLRLLDELTALPLRNARKGAVQELVSNAKRALGEQQKDLQKAEGTVAKQPAL
jgi:hypothetical protein